MSKANELNVYFDKLTDKIQSEIIKAQQETAKQIETDARAMAPGRGPYSESIKARDTEVQRKKISTKVSTDMMTPVAISTGRSYNLGFLLETGTNPHAIPNAFDWGRIYGYDSAMYKRTLADDWHPGFVAMPHLIPALNKNKTLYENNIMKALERAMK